MTTPYRYQGGAWQPLAVSEGRLFYDGAWHSPCDGPKTLWHYVNGAWVEYNCGPPLNFIYFFGYPDVNENSQRVQAIKPDGSTIVGSNKVTAFTISTQDSQSARDFNWILVSRDYVHVYAKRNLGTSIGVSFTFTRDVFTYFNPHSSSPIGITFDLTNQGNNVAPAAPLYVEFEIASDGGFNGLMYGSTSTLISTAPIVTITYDDLSTNQLGLYDSNGDGHPDGIVDLEFPSAPLGLGANIDETSWHKIYWKIPDGGQQSEMGFDSVINYHPGVHSGASGKKIKSITVGVQYDNSYGGGYWYMGRVRIGTAYQDGSVATYAAHNDGYPWPNYGTTPVLQQPQSSDSPDLSQHRQYFISLQHSGTTPDPDITWSYPSFSVANQFPPSGGAPAQEIWELDTTVGDFDPTLTNHPTYPNKRIYRINHGNYATYPNAWINLRPQITGHGLDATVSYLENSTPVVSLYRIDIATDTRTLLKSGFDYSGGDQTSGFNAQFSPSGNKISWFKGAAGQFIGFCNRDGSGYFERSMVTWGPPANFEGLAFDPTNENEYYYTGYFPPNQYCAIYKGYVDNVTSPVNIWLSTNYSVYQAQSIPVLSPDASKIAFIMSGTSHPDLYVMNKDGSSLTNITSSIGLSIGPRSFTWSKDGTQIAVGFQSNTGSFPSDNLVVYIITIASGAYTQIISGSDGIPTEFSGGLKWFYGHNAFD